MMAAPTTPCEVMRRERELGYRAVQVLAFIGQTIAAEGRSPPYRQICAEFNIDRGNLSRLIESLERRGSITRTVARRVRRVGRMKGEAPGFGTIILL